MNTLYIHSSKFNFVPQSVPLRFVWVGCVMEWIMGIIFFLILHHPTHHGDSTRRISMHPLFPSTPNMPLLPPLQYIKRENSRLLTAVSSRPGKERQENKQRGYPHLYKIIEGIVQAIYISCSSCFKKKQKEYPEVREKGGMG